MNKCVAPRCFCDVKLGSRFVSTLLQTNTANIKSRPAKKQPLKSLERPCSVQLIESGIIVAPRSYILLFWDCPLIRIGIKRLYSGASNEENVLFSTPAAVKPAVGLPFPPPYGFTQLGGLVIHSLMTSHMLREPVGIGKKKNNNNRRTHAQTNPGRV